MSKLILLVSFTLAACESPPPCDNDLCLQERSAMRLMLFQGMVNNLNQPQFHPTMPVFQPVQSGISCSTNLGVTYCQ